MLMYVHMCVGVCVYLVIATNRCRCWKKLVVPAANEAGPATLWALATLEIKEKARRGGTGGGGSSSGSQKRTDE